MSFVAEPAEIGQAYLIPPSELRLPVVRENPVIH
jgi:hypothetical protein